MIYLPLEGGVMETKSQKLGEGERLRSSLMRTWGKEKFDAVMDSLSQLQKQGIDTRDLGRDLDSFIQAHIKDREIFFNKDGL